MAWGLLRENTESNFTGDGDFSCLANFGLGVRERCGTGEGDFWRGSLAPNMDLKREVYELLTSGDASCRLMAVGVGAGVAVLVTSTFCCCGNHWEVLSGESCLSGVCWRLRICWPACCNDGSAGEGLVVRLEGN